MMFIRTLLYFKCVFILISIALLINMIIHIPTPCMLYDKSCKYYMFYEKFIINDNNICIKCI